MKKIAYHLLAIIVAVVVMVSCGGTKVQDKNYIRFAVWDNTIANYWRLSAEGFMKHHPEVTVEIVDIPSADYDTKMNIMLASGDNIDVITMKTVPQLAGSATKGQVVPLESYIERDGVDLSPYGQAITNTKINDNIYILPLRNDVWLLYYNKDIFDAAGLPYPTNDMTWEEFRETAKKLTSGGGSDKIYGAYFHTWNSSGQMPALASGTGNLVSGDYNFLRPSYELILAMQNNDKTIMDFGSLKASSIHYTGPFYKGQVAMLPMLSHFVELIANAKKRGETNINWGIAAMPHFAALPAGTTSGAVTGLAINANSPNKELAWQFVKYATGEENSLAMAKTATRPGFITPNINEQLVQAAGLDPSNVTAYNAVPVSLDFPPHPQGGVIERIVIEEHELIMLNANSIDAGLKAMTNRVAKLGN